MNMPVLDTIDLDTIANGMLLDDMVQSAIFFTPNEDIVRLTSNLFPSELDVPRFSHTTANNKPQHVLIFEGSGDQVDILTSHQLIVQTFR